MDKRFNIHGEERRKQLIRFKEILETIDKKALMEAFELGLDIGFFKGMTADNDLFLQFNDEKRYVYTIIRMPIRHMKHSPGTNIASAILKKSTTGGVRF